MAAGTDPRNTVVNMLFDTFEKGAFSSDVISRLFNDKKISERDLGFALSLYLGTLERLPLIDYSIAAYSKVAFEKIKPTVRNILRISIYQMFFMDSVPERAAVSEGLRLLERRNMASLKGYANGVLRTIQREGLKEDAPEHVKACAPEWIYNRLCEDLGKEEAKEFLRACLFKDEGLYVCVNTLISSKEETVKVLEEDGAKVLDDGRPFMLKIALNGRLEDTKAFKRGLIYVQSPDPLLAFMDAFKYCKNDKDPLILDVCAAPGGKSIDAAIAFPKATVISRDRSKEKVSLIKENADRLQISNIHPQVWDAEIFDDEYKQKADIVIADLPCSGLGVIGQKPDIKYRLKSRDIQELSALQMRILESVSGYVKEGGILIYSTCTLTGEENGENALRFSEDPGFELLCSRQYLTFNGRADGFYAAVFTKN